MEILNDNELHLKFLLRQSVYVEGLGYFHSPTLEEIVNMTESKYNESISALLFDKSNLEINNEEIDNYTDFQVISSLVYNDDHFRSIYFAGLQLHFSEKPTLNKEYGFTYFGDLSEDTIITEEKYEYIKRLVRIANHIAEQKKDEMIAGNERARKFIEEQKKRKALLAKLKKPKFNLHSIISAVGWKAQKFDFINNLNIYQLYDAYSRLHVLDNYHYIMSGIYAGTVDDSKIKSEDIDWANIYNTNK